MLPSGKKKEKLIETYEGLSVIGEGVVVEVDEDGEISGITIYRMHSDIFVSLTVVNMSIDQHNFKVVLDNIHTLQKFSSNYREKIMF